MATTQEIVQEVLTQLQSTGTSITNSEIVENDSNIDTLIGLDSNNQVKRITPTILNKTVSAGLSSEIDRATNAETDLQTYIGSVNTELLKRIKGTSNSSDSQTDPFKYIGDFSTVAEMVAELDEWHANTSAEFGKYNGFFRAKVSVSYIEIINACTYIAGDQWIQSIRGNIYLKDDSTLTLSSTYSGTFVRYHNSNGWSSWGIANSAEISTLVKNEIAKVVNSAPTSFDTLKEIADWIATDETASAQLAKQVSDNATAISEEVKRATNIDETLQENVKGLTTSVNALTPKSVTWGANSNMNQWTFRFAGIYEINGERLSSYDNMPITNAASGHTISGRLIVLDSSLPQSSDTSQTDDACITQILMLSNRVGGDGNIYIRHAQGYIDRATWTNDNYTAWQKLQSNIEVGAVTTLDNFIDNGIYSGVYAKSQTDYETFVLITINNYYAASNAGVDKSYSQFKYATDLLGNVTYKTRVKIGNNAWSSWVSLSTSLDLSNVNTELLKRITGTSDSSMPSTDPFKYIGKVTISELLEYLDNLYTTGWNDVESKVGFFRARVSYRFFTIESNLFAMATQNWGQKVSGSIDINLSNKKEFYMTDRYATIYRVHTADGWGDWIKITNI